MTIHFSGGQTISSLFNIGSIILGAGKEICKGQAAMVCRIGFAVVSLAGIGQGVEIDSDSDR